MTASCEDSMSAAMRDSVASRRHRSLMSTATAPRSRLPEEFETGNFRTSQCRTPDGVGSVSSISMTAPVARTV